MKGIFGALLSIGLLMGIIIFVVLFILAIVIGIACLYYGAILIVFLSILKWFGVITVMAVL